MERSQGCETACIQGSLVRFRYAWHASHSAHLETDGSWRGFCITPTMEDWTVLTAARPKCHSVNVHLNKEVNMRQFQLAYELPDFMDYLREPRSISDA